MAEVLESFDSRARRWRTVLSQRYGDDLAGTTLSQAREEFEACIPKIPPDQWLGRDELMRRRRERAHSPAKVDPEKSDYAAEDGVLVAWKEIQG